MYTQRIAAAVMTTALLTTPLTASTSSRVIDAPITSVTVYPDRAGITRSVELQLDAGEHTLITEGLPARAAEASFRASATGLSGVTLLGLSHRTEEHLEAPQANIAELERRIVTMRDQERRALADRVEAFQEQKKLLGALSQGAGDQMAEEVTKGGIKVDDWQAAYRFVGDRFKEVNDSIRVVQSAIDSVDKRLGLLEAELGRLRASPHKTTRTVEVDLRLSQAGKIIFTLEYLVPGASWKPLYQARLMGDSDWIALSYIAEVMQTTGEDWNDVELTLSTVTPSRGAGPRESDPWYLSLVDPDISKTITVKARTEIIDKFVTSNQATITQQEIKPRPLQTIDRLRTQVAGVQTDASGKVYIGGGRAGEVSYIVDGVSIGDPLGGSGGVGANLSLVPSTIEAKGSYSVLGVGAYTTVFKIQRKETVPSGSKAVRTTIADYSLAGAVQLFARPIGMPGAFRRVLMTNQDEAPLMPGNISVFVESNYLGEVPLAKMIVPSDTFSLPFGPDNNVKVDRKIREFKRSKVGDRVRVQQVVVITVTNSGRASRTVEIEEPIPVSTDNRVKVNLGAFAPKAISTDNTGRTTWSLTIAPGQTATISVPYRVEYPSWLQIAGM
ncbi:MAG: mucoidy inhibitor MuiA family protein [Candidatus Zixiibacteriota bacterium]